MKPRDITDLHKDQIVTAIAWWAKDQPIRSRIIDIYINPQTNNPLITLQPLEGNPHARSVRLSAITWIET